MVSSVRIPAIADREIVGVSWPAGWSSSSSVSVYAKISAKIYLKLYKANVSVPLDQDYFTTFPILNTSITFRMSAQYFIVLDDLWSPKDWANLKVAFPDNDKQSRILITTRDLNVAESCCSGLHNLVYSMKPLPFEESKKLFYKRVFKSNICPPSYHDLEVISDSILKKCSGLPLAIVCIGGMLARTKNKTRAEWEKLCDRLGSGLETNPTIGGMRRILALGYHDLPYYLKACFLYLSVFPEDYEIKRRPLVHDIMLEVITYKSIQENFISFMGSRQYSAPGHDKIKRLSIHTDVSGNGKEQNEDADDPNINFSHTRSLLILRCNKKPLPITFAHLKLLRVLDLEDCQWLSDEDLKEICKLTLLRYLSLRRTNVTGLPKLVGRLKELVTLDVRETSIRDLPETITWLGNLKHLLGGWYRHYTKMSRVKLFEPYKALRIPHGLKNMKCIQRIAHIDIVTSSASAMQEKNLFPRLKQLIIDNAPNLDELRFDGGAPNLERLTLAFERQPANGIFGIENLPRLVEVEFFGETIVDSLVQGMIAEAKFHPNRPRVYIEKIELSRTTPNNPVDIIDPMC
ncbi:unnamed protein product [Miscanthus lutarioriparius]|uniref:NB-ARC domain-containing protein n=1 Tax=Miscanthus lutarioriparius TaxID=422564 RepID=A0A811P1P3_9POAL|nr:unnamed protein product [Miscanthus lutarioriparius]